MSFIIAIIVLSILKLTFTIGRFIAAKRLKLPVEKFVIGIDWGKPVFAKKFNDTELIIYPFFWGGYLEYNKDFDPDAKCTKSQKAFLTFSSLLTMLLCCFIIGLTAINYIPSGKYETVVTETAQQLQAGDKILNVNGTNITGPNTFKAVLNKKDYEFPTDTTTVRVERDGKTINLTSIPLEEIKYEVKTIYSPKSEVLKNLKKNLTFKFEKKSFTKNLISIIAMLGTNKHISAGSRTGTFFGGKTIQD